MRRTDMKALRMTFPIALTLLASMSLAQSDAKSDAQKSFDELKTLAGAWQGPVTTFPKMAEMEGDHVEVSLRVTSRGNALVHEMKGQGTPDDPARYDHPVTMFYLDGANLLLTHY